MLDLSFTNRFFFSYLWELRFSFFLVVSRSANACLCGEVSDKRDWEAAPGCFTTLVKECPELVFDVALSGQNEGKEGESQSLMAWD